MRIRKKKWARPELAACPFYVHEPKTAAGTWGERFKKQQPIHLDLGCGKCTFLAKLAHREKDVNFIGIDISEDILGVARRNIEAEFGEEPVENVNLLSYNIEKLDTLFAPDEKAARIYVNFCNPWQKAGDHKRRLTHTRQLNTYKKVLAPGGELWFKTDNTDLYLATQRYLAEAGFEILCKTDDLHSEDRARGDVHRRGHQDKSHYRPLERRAGNARKSFHRAGRKSGKYSRVNSPLRSGHTWVIRSPYSCCLRGCCTVLGCGGFRTSISGRFWPSLLGCFVKWKAASAGGFCAGFTG